VSQDQSCLFRRGLYINVGYNPENLAWAWFPVKMVSVARKLRTIEERRQNQRCLFRRRNYKNKDQKSENSWVLFPAKMVSAARKLSTIEQWRQEKSCLFRRENYRNEDHNPEKVVLGSVPGKGGFLSSGTKHDRRKATRQGLFVSARTSQGLRLQTRKLHWFRVSVKMLSLGIICSVTAIRLNDEGYCELPARNINQKWKHLLNLPA
jgi:hypothetical protein